MHSIVSPILRMIFRVLTVAALLQFGMVHSQEVPTVANTGADGVQRVTELSLSTKAQVIRLNLKAGNYVFYCPNRLLWFKSHRERGMTGALQVQG